MFDPVVSQQPEREKRKRVRTESGRRLEEKTLKPEFNTEPESTDLVLKCSRTY